MGSRERRHHRRRMIAKAYKVFYNRKWALYNYNHMAKCSCYICGNQHNNLWQSTEECLTMQERKARLMEKDW